MRYPLDELIDKISIIQLKFERIDNLDDKNKWINELRKYSQAIGIYVGEGVCTREQAENWFNRLYEANGNIWDLEANIRKGQLEQMSMEEVGKTAIRIRESNGLRVRIKSEIVDKTGIGYKDIKINHASE